MEKELVIRVEILMNSSIGATEYSHGCKPTGKGVNPWKQKTSNARSCPRQCSLGNARFQLASARERERPRYHQYKQDFSRAEAQRTQRRVSATKRPRAAEPQPKELIRK